MTDKYRPSNGSEGEYFMENWCDRCTRDADFNPDDPVTGCRILADTFAYNVTDPNYPKEWTYDHKGSPCCTAFTTDPSKPVRCDKTLDLFQEPRP